MRTPKEIREEIKKVEAAEKQAHKKELRCEARLIELQEELKLAMSADEPNDEA